MDSYIRMINKTEDYIEEHLSEKIGLKELAQNVNYTEYHFHRLFKKYSRETLKQFINRIKMERSGVFLLVNPNVSITEIAQSYGYSDSSSYCKAFKKHFQMTPTEFRNSKK